MSRLEIDYSEAKHPLIYRMVCDATAALVRREVHIEGIEKYPMEGPAVTAVTHKSFWDPYYIGTHLPRVVHSMAKEELWTKWYWAFGGIGRFIGLTNAFPVNRQKPGPSFFRHSAEVLANGGNLLMFPEGTSKHKEGLKEMLHGAARIAVHASTETRLCPVVPIGAATANLKRGEDIWAVQGDLLLPIGTSKKISERAELTEELGSRVEASLHDLYEQAQELRAAV